MYLATQPVINTPQRDNKYNGLMNQGATCYLNSVLQVLFMTKGFREAVIRFSDENPHTEFIDHHLKALFNDLQKCTASTCNITKKLGIDNVYEQRDAAEYFERVLRETSPEASKIFRGLLANKTTCHSCHTETDRDAPFWHLSLSLVDSHSEVYSVVNSIEEFFKPSVLYEENQMYCDMCDEKADATLRDVIKHHPDVLILLLKRFEFNYDYMSFVKINCSVEVPYTLQIPENQTYELYAVVDHFGNLRGGHYTATIKIQDDEVRWINFDDTRAAEQLFQTDHTARSQTAYILFYRKKEVTGTQDFRDVSNSGSFPFVTSDHHDECRQPENKRKREEDETTAELCNDPVKGVCTYKDKDETEIISPGSGGAEVSPPLSFNVDHSESEVHVETLRSGGTGVNEDHKENVQDENTGVDDVRQSRPDNNCDIKPEDSDRPAVCDYVNKDEMRDAKKGEDGNNEVKQSEKKSHEDDPHDEESDKYRQSIDEHQGGEEKTGKDYSLNPAHVHEEGNEKRKKTDFQHDTNGKIDSDKPTTETVEKFSQHSSDRGEKISKGKAEKKSAPTKVSMDTLSTGVDSLTLNESNLPEKQKKGTKKRKHEEDERISSEPTEPPKFSDLYIEVPAVKKKRLSFSLPSLRRKKKQQSSKSAKPKKTPGCSPFSCIRPGSDSN